MYVDWHGHGVSRKSSMTEEDKEYLRDLIAMFKSVTGADPEECYKFADEMMEARKPKQVGIKAVRRGRKND